MPWYYLEVIYLLSNEMKSVMKFFLNTYSQWIIITIMAWRVLCKSGIVVYMKCLRGLQWAYEVESVCARAECAAESGGAERGWRWLPPAAALPRIDRPLRPERRHAVPAMSSWRPSAAAAVTTSPSLPRRFNTSIILNQISTCVMYLLLTIYLITFETP